jgi:hypothetical protein
MKMNVIATTVSAWVLEPVFSQLEEDSKSVVGCSKYPVIAWSVRDDGLVRPITCSGEPEGHFMIRFGEKEDFEGHVYIPGALEVLSPWVARKEGGRALEGVSSARIIEKFRDMRYKLFGVQR